MLKLPILESKKCQITFVAVLVNHFVFANILSQFYTSQKTSYWIFSKIGLFPKDKRVFGKVFEKCEMLNQISSKPYSNF